MDRRQSQQSDVIKDIIKDLLCMSTIWFTFIKSAFKCSQRDIDTVLNGGRVKSARVRPVVTAFQDLCLGAPLSDLLLWETQQKKQNRTEQDGTASPMGHSAKKWQVFVVKETWYPWDCRYQSNQTCERMSATHTSTGNIQYSYKQSHWIYYKLWLVKLELNFNNVLNKGENNLSHRFGTTR